VPLRLMPPQNITCFSVQLHALICNILEAEHVCAPPIGSASVTTDESQDRLFTASALLTRARTDCLLHLHY
jgi:hypothetical protein